MLPTSAASSATIPAHAREPQLPLHGPPSDALAAMVQASAEGTEFVMGIDEAGRGPTLGPMVYGSAFCAVEDEEKLRKMGFMDSKQLTEEKRDKLWAALQKEGFIGWRIRVLQATEISEGMLRKHTKYNLNAMSHDAAIGLVQGVLALGINVRKLVVDAVGDPERYQAKLADLFPSIECKVEPKADANYPIVSAASICAKVPRDAILHEWVFEDPAICDDRDWGCGYPSDEHTKRWMRDNLHPVFGWPDLVRFSWGPSKEVLDKEPEKHGACTVEWPDEEAGPAIDQQRHAMAAFLGKPSAKRQKGPDRQRLLHEAMLEPVTSF